MTDYENPQSQTYASGDSYFDGDTFSFIGYTIVTSLVCAVTLGIAFPWMHCMLQSWEARHTVIHGRRMKFDGTGGQLFGKYLLWVFLTLITLGIYGIWLGVSMKKWTVKHTFYADDRQPVESYFSGGVGGYLGIHILAFLLILFTFGIGSAWASTMVLRWEAGHTHIGGRSLKFSGTGGQLFVKYLLLLVLTPLTFGIYTLFFPVSYTKWQVKHTDVNDGSLGYEDRAAPETMAPESSGNRVLIPILSAAAAALVVVLVFQANTIFSPAISGLINRFGRTSGRTSVSGVQQTEPPAVETAESPDDEEPYQDTGFIFPDSDTELILQQEIENLSDSDLNYAINEIYARHGYIFSSDELRGYYEQFSWYAGEIPTGEFSVECFNQIEQQNWNLLVKERSLRNAAE